MKFRMERVDAQIKNNLSVIISQMDDKRLSGSFVTITEVKTSPDLYSSQVAIAFLSEDQSKNKEILKVLTSSKGYIKRQLASRMDLKRVPDLYFVEDKVEQKANRVEEILYKISKQNEEQEAKKNNKTDLEQ